jgi:hypothetical protein
MILVIRLCYSTGKRQFRVWSQTELERLSAAMALHPNPPIPWQRVAGYVATRTNEQCRLKWRQLVLRQLHKSLPSTHTALETNMHSTIENGIARMPELSSVDEFSVVSDGHSRLEQLKSTMHCAREPRLMYSSVGLVLPDGRHYGRWSDSEDHVLVDRVRRAKKERSLWNWVAEGVPGRTANQCRHRWNVLRTRLPN